MAQNFLGTSGDDVIRGTEVEDHIYGLEGNDVLRRQLLGLDKLGFAQSRARDLDARRAQPALQRRQRRAARPAGHAPGRASAGGW